MVHFQKFRYAAENAPVWVKPAGGKGRRVWILTGGDTVMRAGAVKEEWIECWNIPAGPDEEFFKKIWGTIHSTMQTMILQKEWKKSEHLSQVIEAAAAEAYGKWQSARDPGRPEAFQMAFAKCIAQRAAIKLMRDGKLRFEDGLDLRIAPDFGELENFVQSRQEKREEEDEREDAVPMAREPDPLDGLFGCIADSMADSDSDAVGYMEIIEGWPEQTKKVMLYLIEEVHGKDRKRVSRYKIAAALGMTPEQIRDEKKNIRNLLEEGAKNKLRGPA